MGLGAGLRRALAARDVAASPAPSSGTPAFGPLVFMHRPSAADNPQAPLAHHYSTPMHITPGVVTAGVTAREWTLEGSLVQRSRAGREPDRPRSRPARLVLGAARLGARRVERAGVGRRAHHARGESRRTTPRSCRRRSSYDAARISVSRGPPRSDRTARFTATSRPICSRDGCSSRPRDAVYARVESVAKSILDAGFHPPGTFHRHRQSQVGALTIGYVRDLWTTQRRAVRGRRRRDRLSRPGQSARGVRRAGLVPRVSALSAGTTPVVRP